MKAKSKSTGIAMKFSSTSTYPFRVDSGPPLDTLLVKVKSLKMNEADNRYLVKVTYCDQLILQNELISIDKRETAGLTLSAPITGTLNFDPSDYEKMSLYANNPLIIRAIPLVKKESKDTSLVSSYESFKVRDLADMSGCNIDILPIFLDKQQMLFKRRLEPVVEPSVLLQKSWENLPLITVEITVTRNPVSGTHHNTLKQSNFIQLSVVGVYNTLFPYDSALQYKVATLLPLNNDEHCSYYFYNRGVPLHDKYDHLGFFPAWESLRTMYEPFSKGEKKVQFEINDITNEDNIDLEHHFNLQTTNVTIWSSFHRTLMIGKSSTRWFQERIRAYKWPLEVHMTTDYGGYSFMAPLNLFRFLYPGEHVLRLAVPLQWLTYEAEMQTCGCPPILAPSEKAPSLTKTLKKSKASSSSCSTSAATDTQRYTGADDCNAFILLEIKLRRPLKKITIPPIISKSEIYNMLLAMETGPNERECTGRGYYESWPATVHSAAEALKKVPYYGSESDICSFNRQLSDNRTRVELMTTLGYEATKYVNENFIMKKYFESKGTYEELLITSHACLMKSVEKTLIVDDSSKRINPILRAARHARQMQDSKQARKLLLQLIIQQPYNDATWRELATCLKDFNVNWSYVCMIRALELNWKNPLTILCMACIIFDEDPMEAEPFFHALFCLYPFYMTLYYIIYCYYIKLEMYTVGDKIMEIILKTKASGAAQEFPFVRSWEHELGSWWDATPLMPGMSGFHDAADLLLRIHAVSLAEVCLSQVLIESGEKPAYIHQLALCCRLRGDYDEALCHIRDGLEKFDQLSYMTCLEAECLYKRNDIPAMEGSYKKIDNYCMCPYSIILSLSIYDNTKARSVITDLLRKHPCAYAWMLLADNWLQSSDAPEKDGKGIATTSACAIACAIEALRIDRTFSRAWAMLAKLVVIPDRKVFCKKMAILHGYKWQKDEPNQMTPYIIPTKTLGDCRCHINICNCPKFFHSY